MGEIAYTIAIFIVYYQVPKGFKCCAICQSIVPAKEEKAHMETHVPVYHID